MGDANRWSLRGAGASWSAPKAIDGVPADAAGLDLAVDGVFARAGKAGRSALAAAKFRRVGVVRVKLKKGRNVVRVKRVRKRKLARGSYQLTITPKTGGRTLTPVRVSFRIRR